MTDPMEVLETICESYQTTVSDSNAPGYVAQFARDAIRLPPGGKPEFGSDEIRENEQRDYDVARWAINVAPVHALRIDDDWIYNESF